MRYNLAWFMKNIKIFQDTEGTGKLPPIIVVGNKSDLEDERVISREEGEKMARDYGSEVLFIEASAKGNKNVAQVGLILDNLLSNHNFQCCYRFLSQL